MANSDNSAQNPWERIQDGIKETEQLIGQKKYNASMVRSRQTLEFMVKNLCARSEITESGLIDMIDALFEERIISNTSCEHYHKIRTIGNKAIHEEDNNAYNANQAHHLLSQEVLTFANDYSKKKKRPTPAASAKHAAENTSRSSNARSNSRRRSSSKPSFDMSSLLKPFIVVAIIIVLIFLIKMLNPDKKAPVETTAPVTTEVIADTTEETTLAETSTTAEPTVVKYKVLQGLNVRSSPSTDGARLGLLDAGTEVEFVSDVDEKWCIIKYMGQDAYVAKEFLQLLP